MTKKIKWEPSCAASANSDGEQIHVEFATKEEALGYLSEIERVNKPYEADPLIRESIESGEVVCVANRKAAKLKYFRQSDIDAGVHLDPEIWKTEPRIKDKIKLPKETK